MQRSVLPTLPLLLMLCLTRSHGDDHAARRIIEKRALVHPAPSTLLLIFGLGTPLQLERESVIVGAFAKFIYALPTNASELTNFELGKTGPRSRWSLYRTLAQLLQLYEFGDGRSCVLRAVCEASAAPFEPRLGLLHQLLRAFLSPSSTPEELPEEPEDRQYGRAEAQGQEMTPQACRALYPECLRSPLDVFSGLRG